MMMKIDMTAALGVRKFPIASPVTMSATAIMSRLMQITPLRPCFRPFTPLPQSTPRGPIPMPSHQPPARTLHAVTQKASSGKGRVSHTKAHLAEYVDYRFDAITTEPARYLGDFWCGGDTIALLQDREAWFDGAVITLFSEHRVENARQIHGRNVHHLPTTLMTNIGTVMSAQRSEDKEKLKAVKELIAQAVNRVRNARRLLNDNDPNLPHYPGEPAR